jgi:type III secretory pathway component EscT
LTSGYAVSLAGALAASSAFAATVPWFASGAIPATVRAALALTLTPLLAGRMQASHVHAPLLAVLASGALVGASFGFTAAMLAAGAAAAGGAIDNALASPLGADRTALTRGPLAHLYQVAFSAVFFGSGGFDVLVERFAAGYLSVPANIASMHALVVLADSSMRASLTLAGPSLCAQALATVLAGLFARALPQVNGMLLAAPLASAAVLFTLTAGSLLLWPELVHLSADAATAPWLRMR